MTASRARHLAPVLAISALLAVASNAQAQATHVTCGQTITHDTTLTVDLTNCPGDGLVIGADNITLNLNGHTIDGTVTQLPACDEPPFGSDGIRAGGHDGLTIENGTVQQFAHGIEGGAEGEGVANSDLHGLVVRDNRFGGISFGSNLLLNNHNRIVGNETYGNGCGAGIFLNSADGNRVARNRSHDNQGGIGVCCSPNNLIEDNVVAHNSDTGIAIYFGNHSHNVVRHNSVTGSQDGIFVGFAEGSQDNVVADNHSYDNTNGAITLEDATGNQIAGNRLDHSGFGVLVFGDAQHDRAQPGDRHRQLPGSREPLRRRHRDRGRRRQRRAGQQRRPRTGRWDRRRRVRPRLDDDRHGGARQPRAGRRARRLLGRRPRRRGPSPAPSSAMTWHSTPPTTASTSTCRARR